MGGHLTALSPHELKRRQRAFEAADPRRGRSRDACPQPEGSWERAGHVELDFARTYSTT